MKYKTCRFNELTLSELYDLLKLRSEVFVVEQSCTYLDLDGMDKKAIHLIGKEKDTITAYARILPPDVIKRKFVAIGRVVVSEEYRMQGLGREIMLYSIKTCSELYSELPIHIKAQNYLEKFYKSLGFKPNGNYFLDDFIPHQEMIYIKDDDQ